MDDATKVEIRAIVLEVLDEFFGRMEKRCSYCDGYGNTYEYEAGYCKCSPCDGSGTQTTSDIAANIRELVINTIAGVNAPEQSDSR